MTKYWTLNTFILSITLIVVSFIASSCEPLIYTHGYVPLKSDQAKVSVNTSSKSDIKALWGSPVMIDPYTSDQWVYSFTRTRRFMFFHDFILEKKLIVLTFDKKGLLKSKYFITNKVNTFSIDSHSVPVYNSGFQWNKAAALNTPAP